MIQSLENFFNNTIGSGMSVISEVFHLGQSLNKANPFRDAVMRILSDILSRMQFADRVSQNRSGLQLISTVIPDEVEDLLSDLQLISTELGLHDGYITTNSESYKVEITELSDGIRLRITDVLTATYSRISGVLSECKIIAEDGATAILTTVLKGRQIMQELSSVVINMAQNFSSDMNLWILRCENILKDTVVMTRDMTSGLRASLSGGPAGVVNWVTNFLASMNSEISSVDPSHPEFNSTSIELQTYAAGFIVTGIGEIISALGAVVTAFNQLLGAIISIVGVISSTVTKAVASALTKYELTKVTFNQSLDSIHAFEFVLDQKMVSNHSLATLLRSFGFSTATLFVKEIASYIFLFLENPNDPDNDNVGYELHLASDFDIFQVGSIMQVSSFNSAYGTNLPNDGTIAGNMLYVIQKYAEDGTTLLPNVAVLSCPSFVSSTATWANDWAKILPFTLFQGITHMDPIDLATKCYFPRNTTFPSGILSIFSNELQMWAKRALLSALLIFGYGIFFDLFYTYEENEVNYLGTLEDPYWIAVSGGSYSDPTHTWINELICLVGAAMYCSNMVSFAQYGTLGGYYATGLVAVDGDINDVAFDQMLTRIQYCCDQVKWRVNLDNMDPDDNADLSVWGFVQWYRNTAVYERFSWRRLSIGYKSSWVEWMQDVRFAEYYHTYDYQEDYLSAGFSPVCLVNLPTLTFSGYMKGLVVDGLIIAASIPVAAAAVYGFYKLRNYAAQQQAETEALWYEYQDGLATDSPEVKAEKWKAYKRQRFKYNLLALTCGGTSLGVGMYDEAPSADVEGAVNMITGYSSLNSSTSESLSDNPADISISGLYNIITGR